VPSSAWTRSGRFVVPAVLVVTTAVLAVTTWLFAVPGAASGAPGATNAKRDVSGGLTLVDRGSFTRTGKRSCSGAGLYGDVDRGTAVTVGDLTGRVFLRAELGAGRRVTGSEAGCRFAFVLRSLPAAPLYRLVIGPHDNIVYQDLFARNDARLASGHLEFVIGAPAPVP
jgi:hypothetical protein